MDNNTILILLVVLVFSYSFFSAAETAFSSLNKIKIKALANTGDKRANNTLKLAENFSKLLTTILVCNTIVNVVSASIATVLFTNIFKDEGVAISSIIMTLVIMIIGEIIPKNIAKHIPEKFALSITPILRFLVFICTPLTFVFNKLEELFSKMFKDEGDCLSSEEFLTLVEEANDDGEIEDHEADLISNAIEFDDLDVSEIYTPRVDLIAIDINEDNDESIEKLYRDSGYSRLPVYEDSLDKIIGVLHEKDFYYYLLHKSNNTIKDILTKAIYTSKQVKVSSLLKQFQTSKAHLAIVVDEYGGTEGIITMEDILEELVGEIYDEHDTVIEHYIKVDENVYLVKADTDIEEMFEHFDIDVDTDDFEFNTTSAWVIDNFDKIPNINDSFDFKNMHIEVTDADDKKVNEIKITFIEEEQENEK